MAVHFYAGCPAIVHEISNVSGWQTHGRLRLQRDTQLRPGHAVHPAVPFTFSPQTKQTVYSNGGEYRTAKSGCFAIPILFVNTFAIGNVVLRCFKFRALSLACNICIIPDFYFYLSNVCTSIQYCPNYTTIFSIFNFNFSILEFLDVRK